MKRKKYSNKATFLISDGLVAGVGSKILTDLNNSASLKASEGIRNYASFYPTIGTLAGAGLVLKYTKKLTKLKF